MIKALFLLALRGFERNKKRTYLTISAFIIGFTGLFILAGYILRVERVLRTGAIYERMNGHLMIRKKGAEDYWRQPKSYLVTADQVTQLKADIPRLLTEDLDFFNLKLRAAAQLNVDSKSVPVFVDGFSIEGERLARTQSSFKAWFQTFFKYSPIPFKETKEAGHFGASVTPAIARQFGHNVFTEKDSVNFEAQLVGLDFTSTLNAIDVVINKLHLSGSNFLKTLSLEVPLEPLQEFAQTKGISEFNIFLKDPDQLKASLSKVQALLQQPLYQNLEVYPFNIESISPEYVGNMGILYVILLFFVFLIGGSVVLSVINVLTMSIKERSMEIGTLLSLGFPPSRVETLFLMESLIIGVVGSVIGALLSVSLAFAINRLELPFEPPGAMGTAYVTIDLTLHHGLALAIVLCGVVTLASSFLIKKQTQKKLVYLLYNAEAFS